MSRTLLLLPAVLLALPALAADGDKRFSVGLSAGIRPNMANLGTTITKDGTLDVADSSMAAAAYGTDMALMSDQDNISIWNNSEANDDTLRFMGEEPVLGGPMTGIELALTVQYEFDDVLKAPLYVRSGFMYTTKLFGGHQERVMGDVAEANGSLAALLALNGQDPADYSGGTMITDYDAQWFEIPLSIGVKVNTNRPYTFAYGGFGASFFSGGFEVGLDVDEQYANALATHLDPDNFGVNNLSPGAVSDVVAFNTSAIGMNWHLGGQMGLGDSGVAITVEFNGSGTAETVLSDGLKPETQQLLTAASSEGLSELDDDWFENIGFPVVMTGASIRIGVRWYAF